jgi:hypothetical protein
MDDPNGGGERWVKFDWRLMFFFSKNKIEYELRDEMIIGENEWIKEYYMLGFNFELNLKIKNPENWTKLDRFMLVRFNFEPNQTRSNTYSVWFLGFINFVRTTYIVLSHQIKSG